MAVALHVIGLWLTFGDTQLRGGDCVKKTRKRHAVREMEVDPSEPPCEEEASNRHELLRSKAAVVNVMVKRRGSDHVRYGRERRAQANL